MKTLAEMYQFLFISSIIFMIYIVSNLVIKIYGRFKLQEDIVFKISNIEKIILWISLGIFLTYLIK